MLKLNELPPQVLMLICQNLTVKETTRLTLTSRKVLKASYDDCFEGVWVIHSFHQILSKTGLTGLRNNQLQRVDQALYKMHYQCESLLSDCKEV